MLFSLGLPACLSACLCLVSVCSPVSVALSVPGSPRFSLPTAPTTTIILESSLLLAMPTLLRTLDADTGKVGGCMRARGCCMWVGRVGWTECVRLVSTFSTHIVLKNEVAFSKAQSKKSKFSRTRISHDLNFLHDLCTSPNYYYYYYYYYYY